MAENKNGSAPDMLTTLHEAMKEFQDQYKDARRAVRSSVSRPLDAEAEKLPAAERRALDQAWLADPVQVAGEADEVAVRFKLSAERPIPKRVWQRVQRAMREAE